MADPHHGTPSRPTWAGSEPIPAGVALPGKVAARLPALDLPITGATVAVGSGGPSGWSRARGRHAHAGGVAHPLGRLPAATGHGAGLQRRRMRHSLPWALAPR